jgi:prepilin-type N-terminal cleavage/methylation domain-containing protein
MPHHKSTSENIAVVYPPSSWSRAFTLIEIVITVALSAILMLAITQLYVVYGRVILFQKSSINVALGGSSIMDATRTAGLQAKQVVATRLFSGINYTSGATTTIFELPAIDASGTIIPNEYDYIAIYASSTSVYRLVEAAPGSSRISGEKQLTNVLEALNFTYDNPSFLLVTSVTVDATTSAVVRGETAQTHLREHIYLRNL